MFHVGLMNVVLLLTNPVHLQQPKLSDLYERRTCYFLGENSQRGHCQSGQVWIVTHVPQDCSLVLWKTLCTILTKWMSIATSGKNLLEAKPGQTQ